MRIAFKEWAVVVDALGRGEQILILRKGGIREGAVGFRVEHPEFVLFPTLFHQQRASVVPAAQERYDQIASSISKEGVVGIEYWARVIAWYPLDSLASAERLRGYHIWRDEVIADRFEWGRSRSIFTLVVRIFRLRRPRELPLSPNYAGCKSWVDLDEEVDTAGGSPVLADADFRERLDSISTVLGSAHLKREPPLLESA